MGPTSKYISGKLRDTVKKLDKNGIKFSELVIVTPRPLTAQRQQTLKLTARNELDVHLSIYERQTLVNRLSDFSNGMFHRHFPSIEQQVELLKTSRPLFQDTDSELETAMLRVSLALVHGQSASVTRKTVFDYLILAVLQIGDKTGLMVEEISKNLAGSLQCGPFQDSQIAAALRRLQSSGLVANVDSKYTLTEESAHLVEGITIRANQLTISFVSDIVEDICQNASVRVSMEDRRKIERNVKAVLAEIFRLMGIELANQFCGTGMPSPLYLEASGRIHTVAQRQLDPQLGTLLVAALADIISNPSVEQSHVLASWARAYVGAAVMNLDPVLQEFQQTRLRGKIFILDTDFVLPCVVREHPRSNIHLALVQKLVQLGCRVIVPRAVIEECMTHARLSPRTYRYFGEGLLGMTDALVSRKVNNVLVKGYYHGKKNGLIASSWSFEDYLANYYDTADPVGFMEEVIIEAFPSTVELLAAEDLLESELPSDLVDKIAGQLKQLLERTPKAEYRTEEEMVELAYTDARLFATALQLNTVKTGKDGAHILGGNCYIVTNSSRYLRGAKNLGVRDVVSTRPQQLVNLLELVAGPVTDDIGFVQLLENPLLGYAVDAVWNNAKVLLDSGIRLAGKSLVRLRRDLDDVLNTQISALAAADDEVEAEDENATFDSVDREYLGLYRKATALGYPLHPALQPLQEALSQAESEAETAKKALNKMQEAYSTLEGEITRFGKKKERYLRRIARQAKG